MSASVSSDPSPQPRRRSGINITVFSDAGELVKIDDVLVDQTLQKCLISRALVDDLVAEYQVLKEGFALDDGEMVRPIIGNVELQWHRRGSGKPYIEIFDVLDTTSPLVVLRKIPEEEASEVFSLGLEMQTEAQKFQQEKRKQELQEIRNKQKEEQSQREKQKQAEADEKT